MTDNDKRQKLKRALENINSLPAMPAIAQKLLALPLDTDAGETQLIKLIGQDPQISARIIGLANSPMMGLSRRISLVNEAATLLGINKVKSVAIGIASMSNFVKLAPGKHFNPHDLWLHSMTIAITMRDIAQSMPRSHRPDEDQIFLSGLLHDIGFMALHHVDSAASNDLHLQIQQQAGRPVQEIEMEVLGITHCQTGAHLGWHWNLPPEIIEVLAYHHPPILDKEAGTNALVHLVAVAEKLLPNFSITEHTSGAITEQEWQALGIDPEKADDIQNSVNELAVQASQLA
ncbi:MAG: HDOD domain-containing protein [Nitrosomonadales bacterium]|nr:HDOD domain-containing protein [Nitrosomonadales bacterium]